MKMIAFYNNKGGVGKTSTAINIAYTLSRRQNRILLVDFDGQCNSSRFFTDLANDECGCESAIVNAEEMPLIKSTRYDNIDIVTSSMRMNSISNDFASQYILSLSENKTIIVVDGADEVTRQLLKIGNNINQIAIVANTSRKNESELPNYYLKRITDYQNEIMKLLKSLLLAVTNAESDNEESKNNNGG